MKLEDKKFTDKEVKRILAEAAERESRDIPEERTIGYNQLVEIAKEAQIDLKYLKVSAKQLVRESGGLEKAAVGRMLGKTKEYIAGFIPGFFTIPTSLRRDHDEEQSNAHTWGSSSGMVSSAAVAIGCLYLSSPSYPHHHGSFLLIPIVQAGTNLASGIYEWYRKEKSRLVEEMNGESEKKD